MKRTFYLSLTLVFSMAIFSSCDLEEKVKDSIETCVEREFDSCEGLSTIERCTNAVESWYTYNDKTYDCASVDDCDSAEELLQEDIAEDCLALLQ